MSRDLMEFLGRRNAVLAEALWACDLAIGAGDFRLARAVIKDAQDITKRPKRAKHSDTRLKLPKDLDMSDEITLEEVAHRKYADKAEQQCTCQDFTGLRHCICEDE